MAVASARAPDGRGVSTSSARGELLAGGLSLGGLGALPQLVTSFRLQDSLTDPLAVRFQ